MVWIYTRGIITRRAIMADKKTFRNRTVFQLIRKSVCRIMFVPCMKLSITKPTFPSFPNPTAVFLFLNPRPKLTFYFLGVMESRFVYPRVRTFSAAKLTPHVFIENFVAHFTGLWNLNNRSGFLDNKFYLFWGSYSRSFARNLTATNTPLTFISLEFLLAKWAYLCYICGIILTHRNLSFLCHTPAVGSSAGVFYLIQCSILPYLSSNFNKTEAPGWQVRLYKKPSTTTARPTAA
jgi:hypothetical protein